MKLLDQTGFNQWAKDYDKTVQQSNNENTYPFAGYDKLIAYIANIIPENQNVLDLGIGTGVLAKHLSKKNCSITGVDFSLEMMKLAKDNIPEMNFIKHDLAKGIPFFKEKFDYIVSTYAFHHFDLAKKVELINQAMRYLQQGQKLIIGDVSFNTRYQFLDTREHNYQTWDDSEHYFVFQELKDYLETYEPEYIDVSFCAGIIILTKPITNTDNHSNIEVSI